LYNLLYLMNPVYAYLYNAAGVKLSAKTISKRLNIKHKCVLHYCFKDNRIRRVNGMEVGTGKRHINVFTIDP
jgi:hypothetical protein